MDIRNWSIDDIMKLPDNCFGRRWFVGLTAVLESADAAFDISEMALPEKCVIWSVNLHPTTAIGSLNSIGLALGDHLPVTEPEFAAFDLLFPDWMDDISGRGHLLSPYLSPLSFGRIRKFIPSAGRRIVLRGIRVEGTGLRVAAQLVVSSVPTEAPDWLISG